MSDRPKNNTVLKMTHINKDFFGNRVLENVSMEVNAGEIFAIIGQNGAGKSTLMKVLAGIHPKGTYTGEIRLDEKTAEFRSVRDAEMNGVIMIPQEIEVFTNLSVAENLFFNRLEEQLPIQWNKLFADAEKALAEYGLNGIDPRGGMGMLTRGEQQMVLIVKALSQAQQAGEAKVLILDEPTASLTESETQILFKYLDEIKKRGIACLYISHRLAEVFQLADRIMVMRNGAVINVYVTKEHEQEEIISCMIGEKLKQINTEMTKFGKEILSVKNLVVYDKVISQRRLVNDLNFKLHEGEVLGVFGLLGAGKSETAMAVYAAWEGKVEGEISLEGNIIKNKSTLDAIHSGIGFLPEDRRQALFDVRSIRENMSIVVLDKFQNKFKMLNLKTEFKQMMDYKESLKLKGRSIEDLPSTLSGGNKQKALVARVLAPNSKVLIFDEPSVGVDIGTRMDLYDILRENARRSRCGILVFSSDVDEILQVSDQILVLKNGREAAFFDQESVKSGKVDQDLLIMNAISA